ncbi:hypothetical protein HDU91_006058 [Kappamyces sp. JEL0680]|nr:hypothetical protein HDU91_006058 [Kappamyces sp. JEL0680]
MSGLPKYSPQLPPRREDSAVLDSRDVVVYVAVQSGPAPLPFYFVICQFPKEKFIVYKLHQGISRVPFLDPGMRKEAFIKIWQNEYPQDKVVAVGLGTKSVQETAVLYDSLVVSLEQLQDHASASRTFANTFALAVVTSKQAWLAAPAGEEKSPIAWVDASLLQPQARSVPRATSFNDTLLKKSDGPKNDEPTRISAAIQDERLTLNFHGLNASEFDDEDSQSHGTDGLDWSTFDQRHIPCLTILIMIVGSRGDVQPFVALGRELRKHGHRVRLATHQVFKEFYPLAGDPAELMAFMVKNPGLIPGYEAIVDGEVGKKRAMIEEILESGWKACISADPATQESFTAQAIIANPPSFAHIHCAEKLAIPLHIYFTMPWSPTRAFHHPLVNIHYSHAEQPIVNMLSYDVTEAITWSGLGDIINRFRKKTLGLHYLVVNPGKVMSLLHTPHTYCWSPHLIPKPKDWGPHIDISGFFFLDLATNYTPPSDLVSFLNAGPEPVYIGFGSIVLDDPDGLTDLIFRAVQQAGVRAIVSKGWGGFGGKRPPDNVFLLGNCPHDWLFERVSAVCHHGGAGTTAIGLLKGRPSIVVPFFGDQPFWGAMISRMGVGPDPIPNRSLTSAKLAEAIKFCLSPAVLEKARNLGMEMSREHGVQMGVKSFHRHLPLNQMTCLLLPTQLALYQVPMLGGLRLGQEAANILVDLGKIRKEQLTPYRLFEWHTNINEAGETVAKVDSISKGTVAGVRAFGKGITQGMTDLVALPIAGAREEGLAGLGKGFLLGVGSLVAKPLVGSWELVYQPLKGAYKGGKKVLGGSSSGGVQRAATASASSSSSAQTPVASRRNQSTSPSYSTTDSPLHDEDGVAPREVQDVVLSRFDGYLLGYHHKSNSRDSHK